MIVECPTLVVAPASVHETDVVLAAELRARIDAIARPARMEVEEEPLFGGSLRDTLTAWHARR